jgi:hypothetical protein
LRTQESICKPSRQHFEESLPELWDCGEFSPLFIRRPVAEQTVTFRGARELGATSAKVKSGENEGVAWASLESVIPSLIYAKN